MLKVCQSIVQIAPVLALVCGFYASPASAIEQHGNQTIIDFDELPVGTTTITYDMGGPPPFMIFGGEVITGNPLFPAHSVRDVYYSAGGMIWTSGSYDAITNWPAIGAWVTPTTAPVTATFTSNPYVLPLTETVTTLDFKPNQFLGVTDPLSFADDLWAVSFASAAPFAIDDLTYGAPAVLPGVPELASWVLMLVGFCGLGFALRPSRKAAITTA